MREQTNLERWGEGPWANEPNRILWKFRGLDCLINRNPLGAWCGYVAVPKSHPLYGKDWQELQDAGIRIEVHGGLTYSDHCQGEICHPHDENKGPVFWFGFDCAHAFDLIPSLHNYKRLGLVPSFVPIQFQMRDIYRDMEYVIAETEDLAKQLAAEGKLWRRVLKRLKMALKVFGFGSMATVRRLTRLLSLSSIEKRT